MEDIPIYKFWNDKWISTDDLSEKDVALLINKKNKTIYVWDGVDSDKRTQVVAKDALGDFKIEFPDYKFRLIKDLSEAHAPKQISKTLIKSIKDTNEIKTQIINNSKSMDKTLHVLSILCISLLFVVLGRFLYYFNVNGASSGNLGSNPTHFNTNGQFAHFLQVSAILALIASFLSLSVSIISFQLKIYERFLFYVISTVGLFVTIIFYWQFGVKYIIVGGFESAFDPNTQYIYNFMLNSILVISTITFTVLLGLYGYKFRIQNLKFKEYQRD